MNRVVECRTWSLGCRCVDGTLTWASLGTRSPKIQGTGLMVVSAQKALQVLAIIAGLLGHEGL